MSFTPYTQRNIDRYGSLPIQSIEIRRLPIPDLANKMVNILESKSWSEISFDTYFHLYAVLTFENNFQLTVEKNETITISGDPKNSKENIKVNYAGGNYQPGSKTMGEMLTNAQAYMKTSFFNYDPFMNNCQDFILAFLRSNKLGDEATGKFIKQPVKNLMENTPGFLVKMKNAVFDLASWMRRKKEDLGLKKGGVIRNKKRNFGRR